MRFSRHRKSLFLSMIVLPALLVGPGIAGGAQGEEVELIGFSADGDFAAVRKTFNMEVMSDKITGSVTRYKLDYIIRLSDGQIMGVYQGEEAAAKNVPGAKEKEKSIKPVKVKFPLEYLLAAPVAFFKKAAKLVGLPVKDAEVKQYPLTFVVPDKGVEASKTDSGIQAKAAQEGKHKVRLVLESPGKKSRTVGKWYVEKKTKPCDCCADKTESRTETLSLDIYWGPALPLVLWKRTISNFYCPDVQIASGTTTSAGWTIVGIQ